VGGADLTLIGFSAAQASTAIESATALASLTVTTRRGAQDAISGVDTALATVLEIRANIGAVQNRLDSTAESLTVTIEDLSACDSHIRDTDYALETARLTQSQILQEAGLAILAQANALPKTVLEMLMS
jgi:flagellin